MSFSSDVLATSPIAYWRWGEASGAVAADSSGFGHDGSYVGSPTLGVTGLLTGDPNTAVTLNKTTQYITVPDHADFDCFEGNNAFTLAFLLNGHTADGNYRRLFEKSETSAAARIVVFSQNTVFGWERHDSSGGEAIYIGAIGTGRYFIVANYDGTNMRLYMAGSLAGGPTASARSVPALAHGLDFNAEYTHAGANMAGGTYDEGIVWNRAITSTEVSTLWTSSNTAPALGRSFGTIIG